jgi:hypothetical protein
MTWPNQSAEPTAIGTFSSAIAVDITPSARLSSGRWAYMRFLVLSSIMAVAILSTLRVGGAAAIAHCFR